MLVVVIYNEFINETLNLVTEYTLTYTYIHIRGLIKISSWKAYCIYNVYKGCVNCVKPKIGLSNVTCMTISWVRMSCTCLKINF